MTNQLHVDGRVKRQSDDVTSIDALEKTINGSIEIGG